ncbi:MAG TPA: OsmC family protein [Vicinamibacterales bacterium]|nr:OsmC family protein [Vicinamibacterales bacterium]
MERPDVTLDLTWLGELRLAVTAGAPRFVLDSDGREGPSPMQALAAALAACMAMDVVEILRKGRHDLQALSVHVTGRRAGEPPRRYEAVALHFRIGGPVPPAAAERAVALSREKYCSVLHSLRPDLALTATFEIDISGR